MNLMAVDRNLALKIKTQPSAQKGRVKDAKILIMEEMLMSDHVYIKTNFDLCTGCSLCQLACSSRLLGGYNPHRSALRIRHDRENLYHFPIVCNQCRNAYCMNVCPVGAILVDEDTQAKVVDHEKCIGCGTCARYCPIDVIAVDPELKKSTKCDLCGGDPLCAQSCPTGALQVVPLPEKAAKGDANA